MSTAIIVVLLTVSGQKLLQAFVQRLLRWGKGCCGKEAQDNQSTGRDITP